MELLDSFLAEIHSHPLFPELEKIVIQNFPPRPVWNANSDKEELIYQEGLREGYKLALQHTIKITISEET